MSILPDGGGFRYDDSWFIPPPVFSFRRAEKRKWAVDGPKEKRRLPETAFGRFGQNTGAFFAQFLSRELPRDKHALDFALQSGFPRSIPLFALVVLVERISFSFRCRWLGEDERRWAIVNSGRRQHN